MNTVLAATACMVPIDLNDRWNKRAAGAAPGSSAERPGRRGG